MSYIQPSPFDSIPGPNTTTLPYHRFTISQSVSNNQISVSTSPGGCSIETATPGSAGYDIFSNDEYIISPNKYLKIHTGIRMKFSDNIVAQIYPRSGMSTKKGLILANTVGIIDSDYAGEIIIAMKNVSTEDQYINKGDAFAQLIFVPYYKPELKLISEKDIEKLHEKSVRGTGGFGSTDK